MERRIRMGVVAFSLAAVIFTQSMPMNILNALAEGIVDVLTPEETIEREFYSGKAFYKGGKKEPIFHPNGKFGPHFHPAGLKFKHWHYYFSFLLGLSFDTD